MKLIRCYTRYENLSMIREKMFEAGAPGISILEAQGIGKPLGQMKDALSQSATTLPQFKRRILVEIVLDDASVEEIMNILRDICQTGRLGDGKIFVMPVEEVLRIRTGETGDAALY